jgi:hypothetical protein
MWYNNDTWDILFRKTLPRTYAKEREFFMSIHFPHLSYLGMLPQLDYSEYGFRITSEDKTDRLLILTIANSVFLTKQLMVQEAPDLCYQKVIADLRNDIPILVEESAVVTESDLMQYRAAHPYNHKRKSFRKPLEG